jgi:hypothetical protein
VLAIYFFVKKQHRELRAVVEAKKRNSFSKSLFLALINLCLTLLQWFGFVFIQGLISYKIIDEVFIIAAGSGIYSWLCIIRFLFFNGMEHDSFSKNGNYILSG